ncbi:MAG: hypothetical protein AAFZ15_10190 [Bacteroidota bacterium]
MKLMVSLLVFLLMGPALLAQKELRDKESVGVKQVELRKSDRLSGIDFHVLGTSYFFGRRLRQDIFIGGEIGLLPDAFYRVLYAGKNFTEENTTWSSDRSQADQNELAQRFWIHFFLRWKPETDRMEMDAGIRWSLYKNKIAFQDSFGSPLFWGLYAKPAFGYKEFKVGVRIDFGIMTQNEPKSIREFVVMGSPFLRFNFK